MGVYSVLSVLSVLSVHSVHSVLTNRIRCQAPSGHPADDKDMPPEIILIDADADGRHVSEFSHLPSLKYQLLPIYASSTCITL